MTKDCNCGCGTRGWIPLNSKVQFNEDSTISISPPVGWNYVGYVQGSNRLAVISGGATTTSCDCTGSGKCMPFVGSGPLGSTSGCAGNCTKCSMEQSGFTDRKIKFSSGGYVDMTAGVDFITDNIERPVVFKAMFDVK